MEMCELEGTPKQVAWATEIRSDVAKKMRLYEKQYLAAQKPGRAEIVALGLERLLSKKNQASWWIDRRLDKPAVWESTVERLVPAEEAERILRKHEKLTKHREVSIF